MEPTTHDPECRALGDDLASLALGALTGLDRARVLAHLETCPHCTAEVEELSGAADALTALIPEAPPPPGFADRTMDLIRAEGPVSRPPVSRRPVSRRMVSRRMVSRRVAAMAAVLILVALGVGVGAVVASPGTKAPAAAVRTTSLHSTVGTKGTVLLVSKGGYGWLVVDLHDSPASGVVTCSISLADGTREDLGAFALTDGRGSWSVPLPVPASSVRAVSVVDGAGAMVASARVN
jgi:hypothetical protein